MAIKTAENKYSSYSTIFESKVAIGTASTLLKDKIGCGEKILKIDIDDYFNNNSLHQDYVMNFDKNISVLEKIKKIFKSFEN